MTTDKLNILIACEESQTECKEFLRFNCNVFSCDIQKCSGQLPGRHICGDVLSVLDTPVSFYTQDGCLHYIEHWHLIIGHPPCTYLSKVSAPLLYRDFFIDRHRYELGKNAANFFFKILYAKADFVCVENPVPLRVFQLPQPTTYVEPFWFGHPYTKKTLLWLHNLPPLMPSKIVIPKKSFVTLIRSSKKRSKSFSGIAKAMAEQWLPYMLDILNRKIK